MGNIGGLYLNPITFFSDEYSNGDFMKEEFWNTEKNNWGAIVHNFDHSSISYVKRNEAKVKIKCDTKISISIDGLICTNLPDEIQSNEEALIVLNNHLSTFLAILNFGGIFFTPTSEKEITHIELKDDKISQISGIGDQFSVNNMDRAMFRYKIPYLNETSIINFNWVGVRIIKKEELNNCYKLGQQIISKLNIQSSETILFLEAYHNYTLHKWNNTLLLGWAFIEILIDKLWKEKVLATTTKDELNRKKRLDDNRTFSASVKIEFLYTNKLITKELYNQLNKLRSIRNGLIHGGNFITQADVENVFESCKQLLLILTSVEPKFNKPSWTRSGGWKS